MASKRAQIVGRVVFSQGDGVEQEVPIGACEIDATSQDATISWVEGDVAGTAVLPIDTYTVYLTEGSIVLT